MIKQIFTPQDTWLGGHFELALELGETSDDRLFEVLQLIWKHPAVNGCYRLSNKEPHEQEKIDPEKVHIQSGFHLYGIATLPNESHVACGTHSVRETSTSIDWLTLYLPLGSLDTAYNVGSYPFIKDIRDHIGWLITIEKWLYSISEHVFNQIPYKLGLIGFEISGRTYAREISENGIPDVRGFGYVWAKDGTLELYSANWFNKQEE